MVSVDKGSDDPGQYTTRQTILSNCDSAAVMSPSKAAVSSRVLKKGVMFHVVVGGGAALPVFPCVAVGPLFSDDELGKKDVDVGGGGGDCVR